MIRSSTILLYGLAFFFFFSSDFHSYNQKSNTKANELLLTKKKQIKKTLRDDSMLNFKSFFLFVCVYVLVEMSIEMDAIQTNRQNRNGFDAKRNRNGIKEKNLFK